MSVLSKFRKDSPHQFVANWITIGGEIKPILNRLSKRKGKFLMNQFIICCNEISLNLTLIDELMMKGASGRDEEAYIELICVTCKKLTSFAETLFGICLLTKSNFNQKLEMDISKEFQLLENMLRNMNIEVKQREPFKLYDRSKIVGVQYLEKLEELVDFTYTKSTNLKASFDYILKMPLQSNVATAFRLCYEANQMPMDSVDSINERIKKMNKAIGYLVEYEKTLWSLFSFCNLPEDTMAGWCRKYTESQKLIKSIIKYCRKERAELAKSNKSAKTNETDN